MIRTIKHTTALVAAAAALLAAACSRDKTDTPQPKQPPRGDMPISFDITTEEDTATRVLIKGEPAEGETDHFPECKTLKDACKPVTEGGLGYAVGLFGDYTYEYGGETVTVHDIFHGTRLMYYKKSNGNPHGSDWNYETDDLYWFQGGQYIFRAYFPQRLHNYLVSTTNASAFAMIYPSRKQQEDLLIGYTTVDTNEPNIMSKPVEIKMTHALAALRFKFQLSFVGEDYLTSCYLYNDETEKDVELSYSTQGSLVYGSEKGPEVIQWLQDYHPDRNEELYKWAHPEPKPGKDTRVYMKSEYDTGTGKVSYSKQAMAYSVFDPSAEAAAKGETGELYCQNDGWLLIVPQKSYGKLVLCFTTELGGETLYKIALPEATEQRPVLDADGKPTYDADGKPVMKTFSTEWKAGKRYTYTITISHSDLIATVEILDWNHLNHSTEIIF